MCKWLEELLLLRVIHLFDIAPKCPTSFYLQASDSQRFLIVLHNISDTPISVKLPVKRLKDNSEYKAFIDARIKTKHNQKNRSKTNSCLVWQKRPYIVKLKYWFYPQAIKPSSKTSINITRTFTKYRPKSHYYRVMEKCIIWVS